MFCKKCGVGLTVGDQFCRSCGTRRQDGDAAVPSRGKGLRGRRVLAAVIDYGLLVAVLALVLRPRNLIAMVLARRVFILLGPTVYFLLKDCFGGRSLGKMITGIVVCSATRREVATPRECLIRNLPLALPLLGPTLFAVVAGVQILVGAKQRIGEKPIGTVVVTNEDLLAHRRAQSGAWW